MKPVLDKFDVLLLNLLQVNNVATAEQMSREVALSPSAITRRLRRLRSAGLLASEIAILAPVLTKSRLKALVQVQLNEHADLGAINVLRAQLSSSPEVQMYAEISGPFDLFIIVTARDMAEFNGFADQHLMANPTVRRFETSFVKNEMKNQPAVWLNQQDI